MERVFLLLLLEACVQSSEGTPIGVPPDAPPAPHQRPDAPPFVVPPDADVGIEALSVWGSGPRDVYVVTRTQLLHSDGSGTWSVQRTPEENPRSVYGTSASDVYLAGEDIFHSVDGIWVPMNAPVNYISTAFGWVWAASPNDVWAGSDELLDHFDGTGWTEEVRVFGLVPSDPE